MLRQKTEQNEFIDEQIDTSPAKSIMVIIEVTDPAPRPRITLAGNWTLNYGCDKPTQPCTAKFCTVSCLTTTVDGLDSSLVEGVAARVAWSTVASIRTGLPRLSAQAVPARNNSPGVCTLLLFNSGSRGAFKRAAIAGCSKGCRLGLSAEHPNPRMVARSPKKTLLQHYNFGCREMPSKLPKSRLINRRRCK